MSKPKKPRPLKIGDTVVGTPDRLQGVDPFEPLTVISADPDADAYDVSPEADTTVVYSNVPRGALRLLPA